MQLVPLPLRYWWLRWRYDAVVLVECGADNVRIQLFSTAAFDVSIGQFYLGNGVDGIMDGRLADVPILSKQLEAICSPFSHVAAFVIVPTSYRDRHIEIVRLLCALSKGVGQVLNIVALDQPYVQGNDAIKWQALWGKLWSHPNLLEQQFQAPPTYALWPWLLASLCGMCVGIWCVHRGMFEAVSKDKKQHLASSIARFDDTRRRAALLQAAFDRFSKQPSALDHTWLWLQRLDEFIPATSWIVSIEWADLAHIVQHASGQTTGQQAATNAKILMHSSATLIGKTTYFNDAAQAVHMLQSCDLVRSATLCRVNYIKESYDLYEFVIKIVLT